MTTDHPRVVVTDIDGTLLNYRTELPLSAAEAVQEAQTRGHQIYVCTGRSLAEVHPYILELGFDGMILGNGAYIEHAGEVVHRQCMDRRTVDRIVDWLVKNDLGFYLECNSGLYSSDNLAQKAGRMLAETGVHSFSLEENVQWFETALPTDAYKPGLGHDDVNKISFVLEPFVDLEELAGEYEGEALIATWNVTGEGKQFGEFGQIGVDKGKAVRTLAEHLEQPLEDFIGFGDANVDAPLLEVCGTGVAMGNAPEDLKAIADLVTDDVDRDGFAKAFQKLGLIADNS